MSAVNDGSEMMSMRRRLFSSVLAFLDESCAREYNAAGRFDG
jgi:hypothetical protein